MALLYAKASDGYLASIPVNVMGFTQSLASNGWQKLPSGLIIQWGNVYNVAFSINTSGNYNFDAKILTQTLLITNPTATQSIVISAGDIVDGYAECCKVESYGKASFDYVPTGCFRGSTKPSSISWVMYFALGY